MRLLDLAKKCGAEIDEIVRTIEVQFHESLPHEPNTHVPDQYISRILYMYETLQPHLFNKGYIPEDDGKEMGLFQSSKSDPKSFIVISTDSKDLNDIDESSFQQCSTVHLPHTESLSEHNMQILAKTFGGSKGHQIKLYKIARDLNISI